MMPYLLTKSIVDYPEVPWLDFKTDKVPIHPSRRNRRRTASHKAIEYNVTLFGMLLNAPLYQLYRLLILVKLFVSAYARKLPHVTQPLSVKRSATFIQQQKHFVLLPKLRFQVAHRPLTFHPNNRVFDRKMSILSRCFEEILRFCRTKHVKSAIWLQYAIALFDVLLNQLRV
jgi:hypothetical protein